jgi:hypothetical protein
MLQTFGWLSDDEPKRLAANAEEAVNHRASDEATEFPAREVKHSVRMDAFGKRNDAC